MTNDSLNIEIDYSDSIDAKLIEEPNTICVADIVNAKNVSNSQPKKRKKNKK